MRSVIPKWCRELVFSFSKAKGNRDAEAVLAGGLLCIDMIERTSNI